MESTTEIAVTITSTHDDPDPLALGRRRVKAALDAGYDSVLEPHVAWWRRFWSPSSVRVPDPEVQKLRAQLRRDRKSLETARRRLRDLQVEASLAGVPDGWHTPDP